MKSIFLLIFILAAAQVIASGGGSIGGGGGGAAVWGDITGTLSSQSDLQSALDLKAPLASPTFSGTTTFSALTATTVPYLNASKVLTSSAVTPTELGYVSGVTSAIQTQLGAKAPSASPTFTGTSTFSALTATTVPYLDSSKALTSSAVTPTELGYVSGVTSALQTQLNAKSPSASPTFSGTITTPLTASRVLTTGASSELAASSVTTTTLAFLDATSSIQTQLNGKLATAGTGLVDDRGVTIETPAAATVPFGFVSYAATVNTARTKCEVGSLTANFQICHSGSCTSITSCSAISVTTSAANTSCTAAASIAAGDYVQVVVTSPSSASMCQLGLQLTR